MQDTKPMYSVIIPTYNEASKPEDMEHNLNSIVNYFNKLEQSFEIIIVLDGPTDGTPDLVREKTKNLENIRIIDRKKNRGKGYSVREGMLVAEGKIRMFTDMDGATPIEMFDRFLPKFNEGAEIVIASRDLKEADVKVHQPKWKEAFGDMGNLLIQAVTGLWGVKDTQCGFKALTEDAVEDIFPRMVIDTWGTDFEILMIGKKLGYKIAEVPVDWIDKGESLVGLSGYFQTLRDLFTVKKNMVFGVYKLDKNIEEIEK